MEHFSRELQTQWLKSIAAAYPNALQPSNLDVDWGDPRWNVNVAYLAEHGLVRTLVADNLTTGGPKVMEVTATAAGLDFLLDDGGLSAILGVTTIRFDTETLKALMEARVAASELPAEKKSAVMSAIREAPAAALKEATTRLVGYAIEHWPEALQLLQKLHG